MQWFVAKRKHLIEPSRKEHHAANTGRGIRAFALISASLLLSAQAQADKIYAIGDSITQGAVYDFDASDYPLSAYRLESGGAPNNIRSYREHLHDRLTNEGGCDASVEWVGNRFLANRTPEFHEGRSGWRVDEFLDRQWGSDTGGNSIFSIDGWLDEFAPDHVLIHLGTNDMLEGKTAESARDDLQTLLNTVNEEAPGASVFMANVIPIYGWWADHLNVGPDYGPNNSGGEAARLTNLIENLVAERQAGGEDIHLVDVNRDFFVDTSDVTNCATGEPGNPLNMSTSICKARPDGSGIEADGVHPNVLGDKFIADRFYDALFTNTSLCSGDVIDNSAPVVEITTPSFVGQNLPSVVTLAGMAFDDGGSGFFQIDVSVKNASGDYLGFATGVFNSLEPTSTAVLSNTDSDFTEWSITTPGLPEGDYLLEVRAIDNEGNESSLAARAFIVSETDVSEPTPIPANLFFEAELGVLSGAMAIFADGAASGGSYVSVPEGSESSIPENDYVEFSASIETAGFYKFRANVRGPDGGSNSFYVQINGGQQYHWVTPNDNVWTTEFIADRNIGEIRLNLDVGINTLRVSLRETGTHLDSIEFLLLDANGEPIERPVTEEQDDEIDIDPTFGEIPVIDPGIDPDNDETSDGISASVNTSSGGSGGGGGVGFILIGCLLLFRALRLR